MGAPSTAAQLLAFAQAILLGLSAGLLYDLLRPFRIRAPRFTNLLDLAYCLITGGGVFLFLVGRGGGQLRGFLVLGGLGGAVFYFCACAPLLRPLWAFWADTLALLARLLALPALWIRAAWKKFSRFAKNLFYFWRKCFTIGYTGRRRAPRKGGVRYGKAQKGAKERKKAQAGPAARVLRDPPHSRPAHRRRSSALRAEPPGVRRPGPEGRPRRPGGRHAAEE
ncbi:MAG: hypothetical protein HFF90_05695 [Oscillibacter sp.]|nr:hypothetical protein [Oscillibacter sp.]